MNAIDYLLAYCGPIRRRRVRRRCAADAVGCASNIAIPALLLAAALAISAPLGAALATAVDPSNDVTDTADRPPLESALDIAAPSIDCGGSGDADAGVIPLRSGSSACFSEDWLAMKSPLVIDPFRGDYSLSPFNRQIARLLKQISSGLGDLDAEPDEHVEAAINNSFRLDLPDHKNPLDGLDAPDSLQYQSVDSGADAADFSDPLTSSHPSTQRPMVSGGPLPEPLRTLFILFDGTMRLATDTRSFLRDNQWMFFSPALAFIPFGLMQLRRRRRRYR